MTTLLTPPGPMAAHRALGGVAAYIGRTKRCVRCHAPATNAVYQPGQDGWWGGELVCDEHSTPHLRTLPAVTDPPPRLGATAANPFEPTPDAWDNAANNAGLGVGHLWTNTRCPAYRTPSSSPATPSAMPAAPRP